MTKTQNLPLVSILFGSHSCSFTKGSSKAALVAEASLLGNISKATIRTDQQLLCLLNAAIDTMPAFLRYLSIVNPLQYYVRILRGIILKGIGLEMLWIDALMIALFATLFLSVSINQFRKQLT